MTTSQTRDAAKRYVRAIAGRLDIATTPADYQAVADDIDAFLNSPGAAFLEDGQRRNLQRKRTRATDLALGRR